MDAERSSGGTRSNAASAWTTGAWRILATLRRHAMRDPLVMRRFALAVGGVFLVWLLLVGTLDPAELLAGVVVALLTALISTPHLDLLDGIKLTRSAPRHVLHYLLVFLRALLQSNIDMARRVISPSLPIRPAIVEVHTELRSPLGKLLLANSITLTPGTLTVDIIGDRMLIHWIDITPGVDLVHATRAIAEEFERLLKEFVE